MLLRSKPYDRMLQLSTITCRHNNKLQQYSARSACGNWDSRQGQQPFRLNPNGIGDHTTILMRLLIGAINSPLAFNPTSTFPFLNMYLRLRPQFFPRLKALRCISSSSRGPSKESLSLLYKAFLWHVPTYASPGWFSFSRVVNITKLERLHRGDSPAINDCLSYSHIPLFLSEASLPPLRFTLIHFTLLSCERALRLPTSFPISGLARLGVKPRLCRSSWRALASTQAFF